eukprot:3338372-Ditylum_brightwellii.AAC.1
MEHRRVGCKAAFAAHKAAVKLAKEHWFHVRNSLAEVFYNGHFEIAPKTPFHIVNCAFAGQQSYQTVHWESG